MDVKEKIKSPGRVAWGKKLSNGSLVIGLLALYYQRKTAVLAERPAKEIVVSAGSKCLKMQ